MKLVITNPLLALDVQIAVSKEDTRYYLNGFHAENALRGGTLLVSTDGHRMVVLYDPNGTWEDDRHFPIRLPQFFLKEMPKTLKSTQAKLVIQGTIKSNSATLFELETDRQLLSCNDVLIDGDFPEWKRVLPTIDFKSTMAPAAFNPDYYAAFGKLSRNKTCFVRTFSNDSKNAALVKVEGRDDAFGVLMPGRTFSEPAQTTWFLETESDALGAVA